MHARIIMTHMIKRSTTGRVKTWPVFILLFCGLFGLVASFVLTLEKMTLLENPLAVPSCSLNPIISCSSAINSSQAVTFGIPNSLFGIVAYAALTAIAGLLLVKTSFGRNVWIAIVAVAFGGLGGALYLMLQSVFVLHVICPWCFGIWVTTPLVVLAVCNLYDRFEDDDQWYDRVIHWISLHTKRIALVWYGAFVTLLLAMFWEFWSSLLPL